MLFPEYLSPPNIVAGILIPGSTLDASFQAIRRLERPPIHRYVLARDLFIAVVKGRSVEWALDQAAKSHLADQRSQAVALLRACSSFLACHRATFVSDIPRTSWVVSENLSLPNLHGAVVETEDRRSVVLFHFWRAELPENRLRIIKAALQATIWKAPGFAGVSVEVVTAPFSAPLQRRAFRKIPCGLDYSDADELCSLALRLSHDWMLYHERYPHRSWHSSRSPAHR